MAVDAFSTYLSNQVLDWLKATTFVAAPATSYVALYTTAPGDDNSGTEVTGGSYARVAVTNSSGWSAKADDSGGRAVTNAADVTFPAATGSWGTVTHVAILSASSAGNLWFWNELTDSNGATTSVAIASGTTFYIPAGSLKVRIGGT